MTRTTRRKLLKGGLALGCSVAASPWITPIAFASAPWDNRLVVIILRGAMDGLDVVRPTGDRRFAAMRPTLGAEGLELDDFFTLHPALEGLQPLWKTGEVGFVHAVSTPYRDKRSHFDGQDILEAGTAGEVPPANARDGWLNRLLQTRDDITGETAFAIGRENPLILEGAAPVSRWSPDAHLYLSPAARRLLEGIYHDDPVFRDAAAEAIELAMELGAGGEVEDLGEEMNMAAKAMARPDRAASAQKLAAFAASRLRGSARIATFSLSGWDTHRGQKGALPRALEQLEAAILTLRAELGDVWGKTAVLAMTEFGRTVRENGTKGTDHGTGGAMVIAGGALRGGRVHGQWPGLGEGRLYQGRDLLPTADVRAYAAWTMQGLFGIDRATLERVVFPRLDMGSDPRIVL